MIDISIIIVNFNTLRLTKQCIESIYKYTQGLSYEIIVVDNNSEEDCGDLRSLFPDLILIKNSRNVGFGKANNIGALKAKGNNYCFINSDVILLENSILKLLNFSATINNLGMIGPKLLWKDKTLQWSCREFPNLWNNFCPSFFLTSIFKNSHIFRLEHMTYFNHNEIKKVDVLVGAFMFIPKQVFEQVNGFDERYFMYSEEIDLCKSINKLDKTIYFYPETSVIHIAGGTATSNFNEMSIVSNESRIKYWKKHHSRIEVLIFKMFCIYNLAVKLILSSLQIVKTKNSFKTTSKQLATILSK